MSEKKLASRNAVITLGIICVILAVGLVGSVVNLEYQIQTLKIQTESDISILQTWLNGNITSLNSQIASLNSTIATLNSKIASLNYRISVLTDPETGNAINYIANFMFVPSVGLCRESPNYASNTIWLTNDNLEAYAILSKLGHPRAVTIKQNLDKYGISGNGLNEVLLNRTIAPIRTGNYYIVDTIGQYTIKKDVRDGVIMADFAEYADLCFYWSKNLLLKGDVANATKYYNKGMAMWNGTGFLDKVFYDEGSHKMETYKIGLALWMGRTLNVTLNGQVKIPDYHKMEDIIWSVQNSTNGGIYTHYVYSNGSYLPVSGSDTNVETTAICLLYKLIGV